MNYEEDKIARKEYDTVKVGKPNYTYDDFLKEYYPADYKAQQKTKNKVGNMQFVPKPAPVIRPAPFKSSTPVIRPAPSKQPAVQIETPKKKPQPTMSAEERIAEGEAGKPIQLTLDKPKPQLKSEQERKSQEVSNKNYQQKEAAYHAQVQKTQEENRQKEIKEQQQRQQNIQNAAISMYPSDPEMQKWGQNYLREQGFDQPVEKVNLDTIKKQIDNAYELHTTGKRQEEKHAEVAQEHKRRTDEAAEYHKNRVSNAIEEQKKQRDLQNKQGEQQIDNKLPSIVMAEVILGQESPYLKELTQSLQEQGLDDAVLNGHINKKEILDRAKMHIHAFFQQQGHQQVNERMEDAFQNGTLPTLNGQLYGSHIIRDKDHVNNGGLLGKNEYEAKRKVNELRIDAYDRTPISGKEAYWLSTFQDFLESERQVDKMREKKFGTEDPFKNSEASDAHYMRRMRVAEEQPLASKMGTASAAFIKLICGLVAAEGGVAIASLADKWDKLPKGMQQGIKTLLPIVVEEGVDVLRNNKTIDEAATGAMGKLFVNHLLPESDMEDNMLKKALGEIIRSTAAKGIEEIAKQMLPQAQRDFHKLFPAISEEEALRLAGALRDETHKLTEHPQFQYLDTHTQQQLLESIREKVMRQFWQWHFSSMRY